jgi:hypothetical protein
MFVAAHGAQLTLDGGDRLHALLQEAGRPVSVADAATCLFALRSAPAALVRQLVDEVVRADARFAWRSGTEVALAEWEDAGSILDVALEQADYVVFDLETTGTSPGSSRIVEVGAVRISGLEPVARFERLVDPGVPLPAAITSLTTPASTSASWMPSCAACAAAGWRRRSSTPSFWGAGCSASGSPA